ncbi:MAG: adenosylcobinamide-GDP ribazoletransferase [Eubacteriales bacterium]
MLNTIAVALSMYSAIPVPQVDWSPKNLRYAMIAFPLVGVLCGLSIFIWGIVCEIIDFSGILTSIGIVLLPIIVTGGIHLDGFCDTTDALASHAPLEKKLEILKDSHTGAFAIIGVVCYLLAYVGAVSELEITGKTAVALTLIHVFSRCLSGFSVATFPPAKNSGLLYAFQDGAARTNVAVVLGTFLAILFAGFCVLFSWGGLLIPVTGLVIFLCYRTASIHIFGGITGDLAGWFLCYGELFMVLALAVGGKLWF